MESNDCGPEGMRTANCLNRCKGTAPLRGVMDYRYLDFHFDFRKASEHVQSNAIYPVSPDSNSTYKFCLALRASGPFKNYFTAQTSRQLSKFSFGFFWRLIRNARLWSLAMFSSVCTSQLVAVFFSWETWHVIIIMKFSWKIN